MNRALLLLLVTIVESQSDGILLSTNPIHSASFDDSPDDFVVEDWEDYESPFPQTREEFGEDKSSTVRKRSAVDPLTRRSALDKNFMRFGRSGYFPERSESNLKDLEAEEPVVLLGRTPNSNFLRFGRNPKDNFMRFGRGQKDNFMRFGRGNKDNFMRFGKSNQDNFMRFGKSNKDNFMRFGKSTKDNFMRFGKTDKNFMRFGRDKLDDADHDFYLDMDDNNFFSRLAKNNQNFLRFGKRPKSENFLRFGKSDGRSDNFIRFGKSVRNGTNFLRFGRNDYEGSKEPSGFEVTEDNTPEVDLGDLDLNADKLKNGPIVRIKRNADSGSDGSNRWKIDNLNRMGRDAEIMEEIPRLRKNESEVKRSSEHSEKIIKQRSIDAAILSNLFKNLEEERSSPPRLYSPLSSGLPSFLLSHELNLVPVVPESKRDQSGSNFIRFG